MKFIRSLTGVWVPLDRVERMKTYYDTETWEAVFTADGIDYVWWDAFDTLEEAQAWLDAKMLSL